jgi:hypothetical protein
LKPRDALIIAAVVLIAGFAAADAIRGRAEHSPSPPTTEGRQTTPTRPPGPAVVEGAPQGWPRAALPGSLVFTALGDCRIRVIGLETGSERPIARFGGDCALWAPPVTQHIAYGLGPASADAFSPFRIVDLGRPSRELGGYRALFGVVIWSQDGERVAWCGRRHLGFDLEIGGPARRLPRCPAAYTPDGRIAYAVGNELMVEGDVVLRARGGITYVHYGTEGSVALVLDGQRIERWQGSRRTGTLQIPPGLQGRTPVLGPDNCGAVFPPLEGVGRMRLYSLGCLVGDSGRSFVGRGAAWSPNGEWLAIAGKDSIVFARMGGPQTDVRWPAAAARIAWQG